jgi:hypothetical protein
MDILNFISWIKGRRQVTSVDATKTLLPVGLKDPKRDDGYLAGAITVQDFIDQVGTGAQGPQGVQGPQGPQGIQGDQGVQGVPGVNGSIGPVGPAGLNWQGAWVSGGSYVVDDAVGFGGASWFCINNTSGTTAPNLDDVNWALLANIGATGPQGLTGATGPQGIQGVQGIQGPQGLQGIQGIPGVNAPKFVSTGPFGTFSTTNVVLTAILIPANTFSNIDSFDIVVHLNKQTGYNAFTSIFVNTTTSIGVGSGATQIAFTSGGTTGFRFFSIKRTFFINGGNTYCINQSGSFTTDDITNTTGIPVSTVPINWTQNQYIMVAGRVDNAAFSVVCQGIRIY